VPSFIMRNHSCMWPGEAADGLRNRRAGFVLVTGHHLLPVPSSPRRNVRRIIGENSLPLSPIMSAPATGSVPWCRRFPWSPPPQVAALQRVAGVSIVPPEFNGGNLTLWNSKRRREVFGSLRVNTRGNFALDHAWVASSRHGTACDGVTGHVTQRAGAESYQPRH